VGEVRERALAGKTTGRCARKQAVGQHGHLDHPRNERGEGNGLAAQPGDLHLVIATDGTPRAVNRRSARWQVLAFSYPGDGVGLY